MKAKLEAMDELLAIMDRLLAPDGCPWDREQTHESLTRHLIEESYEVVEAIKAGDMNGLQDELGDVLLQVVFHAALAERAGNFDFAGVARSISRKMIHRHPHVFGEMNLETSEDVLNVWEGFKRKEGKRQLLEGIPVSLPALLRATKVQEKAARVGFDWPDPRGAEEKIKEELMELEMSGDQEELEAEMGDLFFAVVNLARMKGVDAEAALQKANDKFVRRFNFIEQTVRESGQDFAAYSLSELDAIWDQAKARGL